MYRSNWGALQSQLGIDVITCLPQHQQIGFAEDCNKEAPQPKKTPLFSYSGQPVHLFRSRYCNAKHSIHFTSTNEYLPFFLNENDCLVTLAERKRYNFCPSEMLARFRPLLSTFRNIYAASLTAKNARFPKNSLLASRRHRACLVNCGS